MPHYAAVEPQGKGLMVASEKPFVFTHVDDRPVEQSDPEPMEVEKTGRPEGLLGNVVGDRFLCKSLSLLLLGTR